MSVGFFGGLRLSPNPPDAYGLFAPEHRGRIDEAVSDGGPRRGEQQPRDERREQHHADEARRGGGAFRRARNDCAILALGAHADGQHGKQHGPPEDHVDGNAEGDAHDGLNAQACSISTRVPQKSLGCRNSTGLPWAPILGSPSPSTRAPAALSRSRAARMSSTS